MPKTNSILSAQAPIVDPATGKPTPEFYRLIINLSQTANGASAGEVATEPGSGLAGGGFPSDGISLSISDNGVTNGKIRQSEGVSVIGRQAASTGNVADIIAGLNNSVLTRRGNQLFFSTDLTLAGTIAAADLRINGVAAVSSATTTHSIPISISGAPMYILLSTTP